MTDEQIRVAIAEACGLVCQRCKGTGKYKRYGEHEWFRRCLYSGTLEQPDVICDHSTYDSAKPYKDLLPNYLNDLNACHEMEKAMTDEQRETYYEHLLDICCEFPGTSTYSATAKQRAQAFIATIGRKEGV